MGLFDKLKKPKDPQRVKGAAMLFCPETDPKKALDRVEELFQIEHAGDRNNITLVQDDMEIILLATCPDDEGENGGYAKTSWRGWRDTSTKTRPGWWRSSATCFTTCASARA